MVEATPPSIALGAPEWLNADEREMWLGITGVLLRLPPALDAQLQQDAQLSYFEYLLLAMLSEQPNRTLQMSELASITHASLSRLSHVVRRLEQRGLVTRSADVQDRRCTNTSLTDEGMALVERTAPLHVAAVRRLVIDAIGPAHQAEFAAGCMAILRQVDPGGLMSLLPEECS
ncbi:MAG: MarR family transcriptional regulator [Actinomycetota bacterium]